MNHLNVRAVFRKIFNNSNNLMEDGITYHIVTIKHVIMPL